MSSMRSIQKQAVKAQTDVPVDPDAPQTEEAAKHATDASGHANQQNKVHGRMQSAKGGQKITGRKKV